jgi:hypothetical protein
MTNREIVSHVRSTHRLLSSDGKINDRTILAESKTTSFLFIKRETDKRRLWGSPTLFTIIPCIEFKKVSIGECCEYTSQKYIAKSVQEIPTIAEGIHGLLVQFVSNPENGVKFIETTPMEYINIITLGLEGRNIYWWIYNKHLFVSNPHTEAATMSAFFEEDVPNDLLYPDEDCPCKNVPKNPCRNPLDDDFKCPGYLLDGVKNEVSKKLLSRYFNIPEDNANDGKDDQARNNVKQG